MTHAYACWTAANASYVIATEALEGDDAVFLATHTAMTGFEVAGTGRAEISSPDEQTVLDAMSSPDRTHAFCVVQGEPGSGKSHLIRWLSIKWPHSNDVKILLRRSDGSLEGALRQLKQRLPAEFEALFANLGQAQRASELGRANVFLGTLAESLEPHHFDPPLDDEAWCEKHLPAALFRHGDVRQKWTAPLRILRLLEGAGGNRNSASADFDLFDILDLAKHCYGIHGSGVRPATELLVERLIKEAETIEQWAAEEYTAEEIAQQASAQLRTSLELIKALNKRRNHAIQNLLGVSAVGLKALFRKVRERLATRGQRLVLLLEDITSWEGLDDSLIDVLVFNAGARGDEGTVEVCPLISVVGLTPTYYDKLQGNYRGRITHEIRLGRVTRELQDVATLRDRSARHGFAARYLAAVRAGPERLAAWASEVAADPDIPRPNLCLGCNKRDECVSTFGEVAGVSLFPFTGTALDRLYDGLKESDKGLTWKTPRGMLQAVLLPSLSEPHRLDDGSYPGVGIEPLPIEEHRRADRVLSGNRLGAIINTQLAASSEQERSRMRRTFAYWGDPDRADTLDNKGELALAGVSESLLRAFNLPWIGRDRADGEHIAAPENTEVPPAAEGAAPAAAPQQAGTSAGQEEAARPARPPVPAPTGQQKTASPPKKVPTKSELERLRDELRSWSAGNAITSAAEWNKTIYSLIQSLDAPTLGFPRSVLERIVTQEMVKLEGTTGRQLNYLTIAPEEWIRSGLEAYINLKQGDARTSGDQAFYRMKLAAMMRRLGVLVADYVGQRLGRTDDGSLWSPVPLLAQVLLARSWLRGAVAPTAPWSEQLRSILEDESVGEGDRSSRSAPWQEWVKGTDAYQARLRSELRRALDLSLGDGQGIADLSLVSRAMIGLRDDFRFELAPKGAAATSVHEYDIVRELPGAAYELTRICRIEREQLIGRGSRLLAFLGGRGIVEHLTQVDGIISEVSAHLPEVAPEKVSDWKRAHTKALGKQLVDAAGRAEAFLMSMDDPAVSSLERAALLTWLARAPARELDELLSLASQGDQVLGVLLLSVGDLVRSGGTASLEGIRRVGASLIEAAQQRPRSPESDNG
ncbi:hypothetical protein PRN20_13880 [Devosia sp. ZB163]|uniref:hypothetical protein n=1 Tax=Devosia sp. ZB163 TaxID=3025938 RepID=UPI002361BCE3|nr:hypothetical protein [Devosia sp. ZB163]MDC9824820.1 hypothetical protein [Devosia sp. ZB163]